MKGLAAEAKSLVVVMDDLDHPIPAYNHWLIWNLPVSELVPGGIPAGEHPAGLAGAVQGRGYGRHRYAGPKPPFHWCHRYRFTVYALGTTLNLPPATRRRGLLRAMQGHVLQTATLTGHFRQA